MRAVEEHRPHRRAYDHLDIWKSGQHVLEPGEKRVFEWNAQQRTVSAWLSVATRGVGMVVLDLMVGDIEIPLVPSFYKQVPEPSPVAGWYVLLDAHVGEIKAGELVRVTCSNR